jgi:hypothetical protein
MKVAELEEQVRLPTYALEISPTKCHVQDDQIFHGASFEAFTEVIFEVEVFWLWCRVVLW